MARAVLLRGAMEGHAIPVIELWGRLVVPLQGDVTDTQMDLLRGEVLARIRATGARGLVIDASGMWLVDSHLCSVLGRLVTAASLMGTRAVLAGLSPHVVMTLEEMGIRLHGIETALTLEAALESLGVRADVDDGRGSGDLFEQDAAAQPRDDFEPSVALAQREQFQRSVG